jgi:hypothetical protein
MRRRRFLVAAQSTTPRHNGAHLGRRAAAYPLTKLRENLKVLHVPLGAPLCGSVIR